MSLVSWLRAAEARAERQAQAAAEMHFQGKSSYWAGYRAALKEFRAELGIEEPETKPPPKPAMPPPLPMTELREGDIRGRRDSPRSDDEEISF